MTRSPASPMSRWPMAAGSAAACGWRPAPSRATALFDIVVMGGAPRRRVARGLEDLARRQPPARSCAAAGARRPSDGGADRGNPWRGGCRNRWRKRRPAARDLSRFCPARSICAADGQALSSALRHGGARRLASAVMRLGQHGLQIDKAMHHLGIIGDGDLHARRLAASRHRPGLRHAADHSRPA